MCGCGFELGLRGCAPRAVPFSAQTSPHDHRGRFCVWGGRGVGVGVFPHDFSDSPAAFGAVCRPQCPVGMLKREIMGQLWGPTHRRPFKAQRRHCPPQKPTGYTPDHRGALPGDWGANGPIPGLPDQPPFLSESPQKPIAGAQQQFTYTLAFYFKKNATFKKNA